MSEPFLGEIRTFAFAFAPKGWAFCQGQLLAISQNSALFSLLGTQYGGNGQNTFGLPNLQGRAPLHVGSGYSQAQVGGEETHVLTTSEMPSHNHQVNARPTGAVGSPTAALWAASAKATFTATPTISMSSAALSTTGSGQPHDNMPPYLVLNFAIALQGIFPSRN